MSKPQGQCIFCGALGVSKEHLMSKWLRKLFPQHEKDTHTIGETSNWGEAQDPVWATRTKPGHAGTRKVRKVCKTCNNQWISGIDDAAKVAEPLMILDGPARVTPEMQRAIAIWATKIAMVGAAAGKHPTVVTQDARDWLRTNRTPPENWEVWIGTHSGKKWAALGANHFSGVMHFLPPGHSMEREGYVTSTTLVAGHLLIHVLGSGIDDLRFSIGSSNQAMKRIWPIQEAFDWPLQVSLGDLDVEFVYHMLHRMTQQPIYYLGQTNE